MIAMAPHILRTSPPRTGLQQLLLGDLRELFNEDPSRQRDRWILATLDMLLVSRPRPNSQVYLPTIPRDNDFCLGASGHDASLIPFEKLQRLRDRIAHRAPYEALAQELGVELRQCLQSATQSECV
jgi:hypothetical protein